MSRWPVRISQTGGGPPPPPPSSQDRFAPKYLVGNVPAGDSAIGYNTGGFRYIPDTGNGAGIATALAAAAASAGDVWIRPGEYNFTLLGSPPLPLTIPAGVRVQGAGYGYPTNVPAPPGDSTVLSCGDSTVFVMKCGSQLRDMLIRANTLESVSPIPSALPVVGIVDGGTGVWNVGIVLNLNESENASCMLRYAIRVAPSYIGDEPQNLEGVVSLENLLLVNGENGVPDGISDSAMVQVLAGVVSARALDIRGCNTGIEVRNTAGDEPFPKVCKFFGDDVVIRMSKNYGVRYTEFDSNTTTGTVKLHRSSIVNDFAEFFSGVVLESGIAHTLEDCEILSFARGQNATSVGVDVTTIYGNGNYKAQISNCIIQALTVGVRFMNNVSGVVSSCALVDSTVSVNADGQYAVLVGRGCADIKLHSNSILIAGSR